MTTEKNRMETSCGFILLNFDSILLLQYPQGHWSFPKGHIEKGDADHYSTASRELFEETGIEEISIDKDWTERTEYSFHRKGKQIPKQVYWYIAETDELSVSISNEHTNYLWLDFNAAQKQLTFNQEKKLLLSARRYLESKGKIF